MRVYVLCCKSLLLKRQKDKDILFYNSTETSIVRTGKFTRAYTQCQSQTLVYFPPLKADRCPSVGGAGVCLLEAKLMQQVVPLTASQSVHRHCRATLPIKCCAALLTEFHTYYLDFTWCLLQEII